jgi:hypothetical protein
VTLLFMCLLRNNATVNSRTLLFFIIGFFCGCQHEMWSTVLGGTILLYSLIHKIKFYRSTLVWGYLLGMAVMILSPALWNRALSGHDSVSLMGVAHTFVNTVLGMRFSFVLIIVFCCTFFSGKKANWRRFWRDNDFLLIATILGFVPALTSGHGGRSLFATEIFSLILLLRVVNRLWEEKTHRTLLNRGAFVAFAVSVLFSLSLLPVEAKKWETYDGVVKQYIQTSKNEIGYHYDQIPFGYNYFTEDLSSLLYRSQTTDRLRKEKERITGRHQHSLKAIPDNLNELFYVFPFSDNLAAAIGQGRAYAVYDILYLPGYLLKVNYTVGDVLGPHPFLLLRIGQDRIILLNKHYKHFWATKYRRLGVSDAPAKSKFEIIRK